MLWQQFLRKLHKLFSFDPSIPHLRLYLEDVLQIPDNRCSRLFRGLASKPRQLLCQKCSATCKMNETLCTDREWSPRHTVKWQTQASKQSIEYTFCVRKRRKYRDRHTHIYTRLFLSKEILEEEAPTSTKKWSPIEIRVNGNRNRM